MAKQLYEIVKTTLYDNGDKEIEIPQMFFDNSELTMTATLTACKKEMSRIKNTCGGRIRKINDCEFGSIREFSTSVYKIQAVA